MTFSISFDGHQWNIPVESYLFTFMSMFSICSFPGIRRGSCRLREYNNALIIRPFCEMTASPPCASWDLHCVRVKCETFYLTRYCGSHNDHITPPFLLVLDVKSSQNSETLVLAVVQRTARRECYWLNGMTTQGQLPAFTLSSTSWRHVAQIVKAPTGSHFKYFRNLPNHILLSQLMAINVSTACHNQTG